MRCLRTSGAPASVSQGSQKLDDFAKTKIKQLKDERKKLLQAHYKNAVPLDLLKEEQTRITRKLEAAESRLKATEQAFVDIQDALEKALQLALDCQTAYLLAGTKLRRQFNQAFFEKLLVTTTARSGVSWRSRSRACWGEGLAAEAEAVLAVRGRTVPHRARPENRNRRP